MPLSRTSPPGPFLEREHQAHLQRSMPIFLTLRDAEGATLVTAMLPPVGQDERTFRPVIVGVANSDPSRSTETLSRPSRSNLGSCSTEAVLNPTESLTAAAARQGRYPVDDRADY